MPQTSLSCQAVYQRLYQSADHSQIIEVASRLPLEGGKWRISWRLLLVSCRCSPYMKARNNVHIIQVHLGQWPGSTISVLLQSAGKIEMKKKGAIHDATCFIGGMYSPWPYLIFSCSGFRPKGVLRAEKFAMENAGNFPANKAIRTPAVYTCPSGYAEELRWLP